MLVGQDRYNTGLVTVYVLGWKMALAKTASRASAETPINIIYPS